MIFALAVFPQGIALSKRRDEEPKALDTQQQQQQEMDLSDLDCAEKFEPRCCATKKAVGYNVSADFSSKSGFGNGRWPNMYILGAQKAASSSIALTMATCGMVSWGKTTVEFNPGCPAMIKGMNCKENLHWKGSEKKDQHGSIDGEKVNGMDGAKAESNWIATKDGQKSYTAQFDTEYCECPEEDPIPWKNNCPLTAASKEACESGRFMESTPVDTPNDTPTVEQLVQALPPKVFARSRFVYILREPTARLVSWFNNAYYSGIGKDSPLDYRAFYTFVTDAQGLTGANRNSENPINVEWKLGFYANQTKRFVAASTAAGGNGRKDLLILNFQAVTQKPQNHLNLIAQHFGLPETIDRLTHFPNENSPPFPEKVVQIKCSDKRMVVEAYAKANEELYEMLKNDKKNNLAPEYEPAFGTFDATHVTCGDDELTMGGMTNDEIMDGEMQHHCTNKTGVCEGAFADIQGISKEMRDKAAEAQAIADGQAQQGQQGQGEGKKKLRSKSASETSLYLKDGLWF